MNSKTFNSTKKILIITTANTVGRDKITITKTKEKRCRTLIENHLSKVNIGTVSKKSITAKNKEKP